MFQEEIKALQLGKTNNKSKIKQNMPILNEKGLLVSNSCLRLSETLTSEQKWPILLPKHCELIEKYVLWLHICYLHCGPNQTLFLLQRNSILIGGRREVKRILLKCKKRHCLKPKTIEVQMAPLPK